MKKNLAKCMRIINFLQVFLSLALIFSATACAAPAGSGKGDPDDQTIEQRVIGTWAYDYGYNQDEFTNEEVTFNTDKTFIARYGESDYESGTYKIVNDSVYGLSIEWHFTEYGDKNSKNKSDVISLYKCTFDDDDTLHLDRFSRDRTKMGGMFETFDPPRENTYHRIKDGTKELLTSGKWRVNKIGTPDCDWDETWTFNTDGTMIDVWKESESAASETYNGTFEVIQENGKNILHHILDWGTSSPEWWYEYKACGPNLIRVQLVKSTLAGEVNDATINYYYREVETETFYYHFGNVSYKYMVPKAGSYTLINHPWQLEAINNHFSSYEFLGWYDNKDFTGNPVTTVTDSTRDFYAKYNLRTTYETWKNADGSTGADYYLSLPPSVVFNDEKVIQTPKLGENISVLFEATLTEDFDGYTGMNLVCYDYVDNCWKVFGYDRRNIKTTGKKIKEVFNFTVPDKDITFPDSYEDYYLQFFYNEEGHNKANTFSNWKFTVLDETNSYKITYNFGEVSYVARGLKDSEFVLPKDAAFFEHWNWNIGQQELLGWYDNPELKGTPVTSITKGNTSDKTFYAKFNFKGRYCEWEEKGVKQHDYHTTVPVRTLLSETEFNPKPGDTYNILFEATLSHDFNEWAGLQLQTDDNQYFQDFGNLETQNKKLSKVFTIKIPDNANLPSVDKLYFDFWYSDEACDEIVTFSDWKFILLDETNSYNINYKFGDFGYTEKMYSEIESSLPLNGSYFQKYNWNFGESIEILGWYENAEFIGNSVTSIPAGNNFSKTLYAKFNPKITKSTWTENDGSENHNYNTTIPVKALLPGKNINPKAGDTISVYFEAKISHDLDGWGGLRLVDNTNGWENIAQDWNNMKTEGNKLSKTFTIKIDENAKLPSIENLCFDFGYEKEAYDAIITISDWKFEVIE